MWMQIQRKWPDSVSEECLVSQTQVKIPRESVLACFQGVNIPFGYIEIIARSAQAASRSGSGTNTSQW